MAQTIADIKKEMTDKFISYPAVVTRYGLTVGKTFEEEFSDVSIESIIFSVIAFCAWTLQKLLDDNTKDTIATIQNTRTAYIPWLLQKAKDFQYGYNLIPDGVDYDNTGIDPALIAASKVVKEAYLVELGRGMRIKLATEINGDLAPLPAPQLAAFMVYFKRLKPFCSVKYVNAPADNLKLKIKIYYNPLVLNETGSRLDGTVAEPVKDSVLAFLKQQPFNGLFVLTELLVSLRSVEGVVIPDIVQAQAKYGALDYMDIETFYLPDSGYLRLYNLDTDFEIEYLPHEPI